METEKAMERYAVIKTRIKELQKEEDLLKPLILKAVSDNGEPIKRDYGTFVKSSKHNWEYSDNLKTELDNVKSKQVDEVEQGIAKDKVTEYITYKPVKNKNV